MQKVEKGGSMKIIKKIFLILLSFVFIFMCSSCNDVSIDDNEPDNTEITGKEAFLPSKECSFEVIFFDTDNVISDDGKTYENVIGELRDTNNCSDCYMIKCGNVEILIDCGSQEYYGVEENRVKNFCNNILKKISMYCEDRVLDYLIVTHADADHIKNLSIDGGLFDMMNDYGKWYKNYGKKYHESDSAFDESNSPITEIKNIIDFDSYRLRQNISDGKILMSQEYKKYCYKRDLYLKCNENTFYSPASQLFLNNNSDKDYDINHYKNAQPDDVQNNYAVTIIPQNGETVINSITQKKYGFKDIGKLNVVYKDKVTKSCRYTYDIKIGNDVNLRFLYNWYYDSHKQESINNGQNKNNISICCLIEDQTSKLLLLGDLGGLGENGLLKYYEPTDVLTNITCFKASHHGSTTNKENSKKLFDTIKPKNGSLYVIVTGVGQPSREYFVNKKVVDKNQLFYDSLKYIAILKDAMVKNMGDNVKLYITQIVKYTENTKCISNQPFYGDIHLSFYKGRVELHYTYSGNIDTYIDKSEEKVNYIFTTDEKSVKELDWAKMLGLV